MKTVSLSGSPRANVGKTDANALRAAGRVPCVIYGNGSQIHFSADERHFKEIIYTPETNLVEIEVEGKKYRTVLQEAQYHKINDRLIHADFLQVEDNKPVTVSLPIITKGQAEGVKAGGRLVIKMRKLKVRGLVSKLPAVVELDVEPLKIGKSIAAGDIKMDGITVLHPANVSVISVQTQRAAVEEVVAAPTTTAAATPAATADAAKTDAKK
ncbi:MAG: 50S ribosomal protein L25/general stress protein Ctc [Sphingobacteriaceae bacterium]|nr:50S ribosomal protein L25/general stress protein Ctc [Sphingobacteriaceae bacterium]